MTIEETELDKRAYKHYPFESQNRERAIYCIGAIDQQKIDIDKAWGYIKGMIDYSSSGGDITSISKEVVRKAMEK